MRLWRRMVVTGLVGAGALLAPGAAQADTQCSPSGPAICVGVTHAGGGDVSVSNSASPTFQSYTVTLSNRPNSANSTTNTASQTNLVVKLPDGAAVSGALSGGTNCSTSPDHTVITCAVGQLKAGTDMVPDLTFLATAPTVAGTSTTSAQVTVDEGVNDQNKSKQDTTTAADSFTVEPRGTFFTTFAPQGKALNASTGQGTVPTATESEIAQATTPNPLTAGIITSLDVTDDHSCPPGATCTDGAWVVDSIPALGQPYLKLSYLLDATLIKKGQTTSSLVLYYQHELGDTIVPVSQRCSFDKAGNPKTLRCISVTEDKRTGDFRVDFYNDQNGRARV